MAQTKRRAPVRATMYLSPQHAVVIPFYEQEWQHSTIVEVWRNAIIPDSNPVVQLTTADRVTLVVPLDLIAPFLEGIINTPVSYRVRWEPYAERAFPTVWHEMSDRGVIVYDQLVIGERRISFAWLPAPDANKE